MPEDYYKLLGIARGASEDEIKTAYRRLAHKYHPDKAGGDDKMFKKINEAYQVLSNKDRRAQYDRFGKTFDGVAGGGPHANGGQGFDWRNFGEGVEFGFDPRGFEDISNLGDVFDAFFEGMGVKRKRRAYERGADLEFAQEITLEEAFHGTTKTLRYKTYVPCTACSGIGHFPKEGFTDCTACDGRGEIQELRRTFFGNLNQVRTCAKCTGLGKLPNKTCVKCKATGRVEFEKTIDLTIASGIEDGQVIKVSKAGETGERGAEAGDLYVRIKVRSHDVFKREGEDLRVRQEANLIDLLLTRSVEVKTLSGGRVRVEIPAGFKFGDEVAVPGEGMPRLGGGGRGRLHVELDIKVPKKLSEHAKKLLEELKKEFE